MSLRLLIGRRVLQRMVRTAPGSIVLHRLTPSISSVTQLHTTNLWKGENKNLSTDPAAQTDSQNAIVYEALEEMYQCEEILERELAKHFSLQVDLKVFEEVMVKMDDGKEHRMSDLGKVTLKTPQMLVISFADNSAAIENAKLALQKSLRNMNPHHDGVVLYVPISREMTGDRSEQLAKDAQGKMLDEYKEAINEIYTRFLEMSSLDSNTVDKKKVTKTSLFEMKRAMEARGVITVEMKRKELLK